MDVYDSIMKGLSEAVEHAQGKRRLKTNSITIQPVAPYTGEEIRKLRLDMQMTQISFAEVFGVSVKTVEAWEANRNLPDGPARRMMAILQADPQIVRRLKIIEDRND